ncbi:MAG: hypothetical protein AB7V58_07010 [Solirubrobacterales bacterium]
MATMARDSWTDKRLDDLSANVQRLDQRMETGFGELRSEIRELNRSFQQMTWRLMGMMLASFLGVVATVLTQG